MERQYLHHYKTLVLEFLPCLRNTKPFSTTVSHGIAGNENPECVPVALQINVIEH